MIARGMPRRDAALEVCGGVEQDRGAPEARSPAPAAELVHLPTRLGPEVAGELELAAAQDVDGEAAGIGEDGIRGVGGVDAQGEQEGLEADLGDPGGGERVAPVAE